MDSKGWKQIFKFTYIQTVKAKSFKISTIAMCAILVVIIVAVNFLTPLLLAKDKSDSQASLPGVVEPEQTQQQDGDVGVTQPPATSVDGETPAKTPSDSEVKAPSQEYLTLYLWNETEITKPDGSPADLASKLAVLGINVIEIKDEDDYNEKIEKVFNTNLPEIVARAYVDRHEDYPNGQFLKPEYALLISSPENESAVSKTQSATISYYIQNAIEDLKYEFFGVNPVEFNKTNYKFVNYYEKAGQGVVTDVQGFVNTTVPMLVSILLFGFIFAYGALIAQSIALEKCSRVMELLLTSVRPLAVIVGKILAMFCVALTQIAIIGVVGTGSVAVTAPFGILKYFFSNDVANTNDELELAWVTKGVSDAFSGVSPIAIVWCILAFVFGFIFYALISGVVGAMVNRSEDLQSAMQPLSFTALIGFFLAYYPSVFTYGSEKYNTFELISYFFPLSAPFALPGGYVVGKVSDLQMVMALLVLAIFDILLVFFISKVYESVIVNTGNTMKLSKVFEIFKDSRKTSKTFE